MPNFMVIMFKATYAKFFARWFSVVHFITKLCPLLGALRMAWNEPLYMQGHTGAAGDDSIGNGFSAPAVTEAVRNPFFHAYCMMVLHLEGRAAAFASWAEKCPCHEHVQPKKRRRQSHHLG
eukprot:6490959-Amphidinium_carterae.2